MIIVKNTTKNTIGNAGCSLTYTLKSSCSVCHCPDHEGISSLVIIDQDSSESLRSISTDECQKPSSTGSNSKSRQIFEIEVAEININQNENGRTGVRDRTATKDIEHDMVDKNQEEDFKQ